MSGVEVGVALSNVTTEVANVTADLDTRCGELYAPGGEVLPAGQADNEDAAKPATTTTPSQPHDRSTLVTPKEPHPG
jgi:hypothetical protein